MINEYLRIYFRLVTKMFFYLFHNALNQIDSPALPGHFTWAILSVHPYIYMVNYMSMIDLLARLQYLLIRELYE